MFVKFSYSGVRLQSIFAGKRQKFSELLSGSDFQNAGNVLLLLNLRKHLTELTEKMIETDEKIQTFKFRNILAGLAVLLFLLSIFSYSSADLAVLDGGAARYNGAAESLQNWIGPLGAYVSRTFFYIFGIATYPIVALLLLCTIRSFIPRPTNRKGYFLCLGTIIIGTAILFALFPRELVNMTARLGIGHAGQPDLALSGGALGALLAAPETDIYAAGLIRRCIGTIGTCICAVVFILSGLFFIFMADWKVFFFGASSPKPAKRKERISQETEPEPEPVREMPVSPAAEPKPAVPEKPESAADSPAEPESKGKSILSSIFSRKKEPEPQPEQTADHEVQTPAAPPQSNVPAAEPVEPEVLPDDVPVETFSALHPVPPASPDDDPYAAPTPAGVPVRSRRQTVIPDSNRPYELPPISLLDRPKEIRGEDVDHLDMAKQTLQATLDSFDINGVVSNTVVGPRITRFEISLQPGVRVEKVTQIQNNIAKDMRAESIRILAPVPGSDTVGIELPNKISNMVYLRELMESDSWRSSKASIPIVLGKDVAGKVVITDLAKAPHLLIAGSTGSGKSVCMNTLIMSLLYRFSPFELKLILVDPKYVELEIYRPLPHLITPVVNDPQKVPFALRWGVNEMEHRYQVMARVKAKNLAAFNSRPPDPEPMFDENDEPIPEKLPLLIIIVDELADIMMTEAKKDVETSICRIAQKGRAAGIHLVIATQTPRKDIITGVIKANLPTKIAFKVSTGMDSRVILDAQGAEKLLGKGDMLFKGPAGETERIQGSMVSDPEIQKIADFVSSQVEQHFDATVILDKNEEEEEKDDGQNSFPDEQFDDDSDYIRATAAKYSQPGDDPNIRKALEIILRENKASTSYLQRRMNIGYNKAAEIIDRLEQRGIVSAPLAGGQKRNILIFDELNRPDKQ